MKEMRHIRYMFIYMKFKSRQLSSLATEIKTVFTLENLGNKGGPNGKGHKETSWDDRNILDFVFGIAYTGA